MHGIFFYLGLLSQTFTNHRPVGEGRGHFLNSSQPLPTASDTETLISLEVTVGSSPLHIASDQTWTSKALVSEPKALTTKLSSLILPRAWFPYKNLYDAAFKKILTKNIIQFYVEFSNVQTSGRGISLTK